MWADHDLKRRTDWNLCAFSNLLIENLEKFYFVEFVTCILKHDWCEENWEHFWKIILITKCFLILKIWQIQTYSHYQDLNIGSSVEYAISSISLWSRSKMSQFWPRDTRCLGAGNWKLLHRLRLDWAWKKEKRKKLKVGVCTPKFQNVKNTSIKVNNTRIK